MKRGKIVKTLVGVVLFLMLIYGLWNRELVGYGLAQLSGQIHILRNTVPIEKALADTTLSSDERDKLLWIGQTVAFARDSLKLTTGDNYQTVYLSHGKPVLWVVTAAEPYSLTKYKWKFPFLGAVGYKGFFDFEKALAERDDLEGRGFDTDVSEVTAWSTLGFFSDPILSQMLNRDSAALAELIIHELTHTTFFISGDADLNENAATFIGRRGAEKLLLSKGLTKMYNHYKRSLEDKDRVKEYLKASALQLDSAYSGFARRTDWGSDQKEGAKKRLIRDIVLGMNNLPLHEPKNFTPERAAQFNNTFFTGYLMYNSMQDSLQTEYDYTFKGDLNAFIEHFKNM